MTMSIGVGYRGQRYEVSVYDEHAKGRRVVGWTNDRDSAACLASAAITRPSWSLEWVTDLYADISHTHAGVWIGARPLPPHSIS